MEVCLKNAAGQQVEVPALLLAAFDGDEELLAWYGTLLESWRRYFGQWVMEPKGAEARERRADSLAERLLLTMEAEQELPGFLARRIRGTRFALAGWAKMGVNVKRNYLLVLFGTRSVEAREKQVVRLVEDCARRGERTTNADPLRG